MHSLILRATTLIVLLYLLLAFITQPVEAAKEWCRKDPVISINDTIVHLYVLVPFENVKDVTGVTIEISVPTGTATQAISRNTFQGKPFEITFVEDANLVGSESETPIVATFTVQSDLALSAFEVGGQIITGKIDYFGEGVSNQPFPVEATVFHLEKKKR